MEQADKVNKAMINNRGPQFTPLTEDVDDISGKKLFPVFSYNLNLFHI